MDWGVGGDLETVLSPKRACLLLLMAIVAVGGMTEPGGTAAAWEDVEVAATVDGAVFADVGVFIGGKNTGILSLAVSTFSGRVCRPYTEACIL